MFPRGVFWSFFRIRGILVIFKHQGYFSQFFWFWRYFGYFLSLGVILVILFFVSRVFWPNFRFWGYFGHFLSFVVLWSFFRDLGVSVIY